MCKTPLKSVFFMSLFFFSISLFSYSEDCQMDLVSFTNDYYCLCLQFPGENFPVCHGSGEKNYQYGCVGGDDCSQSEACEQDQNGDPVTVLWYSTPTCVDEGWWPTGPECNEHPDCVITGWTDTWGEALPCACQGTVICRK